MAAPSLDFRTTGGVVLTSLALTGSGIGGSIVLGSTSNVVTQRVYNNFAAAGGIGIAFNITFASYDDTTNWGIFATEPVSNAWLQCKVVNYDGVTTGADSTWFPIGGLNKHVSPVNSAQISGTGSHYVTFSLQASVPLSTSQNAVTQGLWIEYTWV